MKKSLKDASLASLGLVRIGCGRGRRIGDGERERRGELEGFVR